MYLQKTLLNLHLVLIFGKNDAGYLKIIEGEETPSPFSIK
jgi:hypothetical protein